MPGTTATILNVDDTEAIRYAKTRTLQRAGFTVLEAGTGSDALKLVSEARPDLVLLDVKLPDISGLEVCRLIKQDHPGVLVLQVSALLTGRTDRVRGLDSGADGYLTQPAEPDEMVAAVRALLRSRRVEDALRESEARLSAIFGQTTAGIAQVDLQGRFTLVNDRYCALVGWPRDQLLQKSLWDITDPKDMARNREMFDGAVQSGKPFEIEKRYVRPDGSTIWVHNSVNLIRTPDGKASSVIAVTLDISDRKQAEERQRLLTREVDHRAKNMLAVVQAMLRLTQADSTAEFVQTVEGRVAALARAHTLLSASRWEGADLHSLLSEEMGPFQSEGAERILFNGPNLSLAPDAAQAFSMVVHELTTNAAKYGCLSVPDGRLSVTWTIDGDGMLVLDWLERGGPPVAQPKRAGFGSTVIEHSVRGQLEGRLEMGWQPEGLHAVIRVPRRLVHAVAVAKPAPGGKGAADTSGNPFRGRRVLVVEDQALVALEIVDALEELECEPVGPVGSVEAALARAGSERLDAAVLDVDLRGSNVQPVAELLEARGVPFLYSTGFGEERALAAARAERPVLRKPFGRAQFADALRRVLATAS